MSSITEDAAVPAATEPPYPSAAYSWYVVGTLMAAYTLSFIDRQILSLLVGPIRADLGIGDFEVGLLGGFAFAVFYTLFGLPFGRAADRYHRVRIISAGILVWSLMTCACGLAKNFWHLFLARMGVGLGEAALSPPAYSLIGDYFPPHRLASAISVYGIGIYIGSAMAFILGGAVVQAIEGMEPVSLGILGTVAPWQLTFFYVGLPGLLIALWMLSIREPVRRGQVRSSATGQAESIPFSKVLEAIGQRWPLFTSHFLGFALMSFIGYGCAMWTVPFLERAHGLAAYEGGYLFGALVLIFGSSGIFAGGLIGDKLRERGRRDANMRVTSWAALMMIPASLLAYLPDTLSLCILGMALANFFAAVPFGNGPAALQHIVPNQMRAQVSAIYLFVVNIIGLGLAPPIGGWLSDEIFTAQDGIRYALLVMGLVAAALSTLLLRWGLAHYRKAEAEAQLAVTTA